MVKNCKAILILTIILLLLNCCSLAMASSSNTYLIDEIGALNQDQYEDIYERLEKIANKSKMNIAVVILNSIGGRNPEQFTEAYYENNIGKGPEENGVILLINIEGRDVQISAVGKAARDLINDKDIEKLLDKTIKAGLSEGDFYSAFKTYSKTLKRDLLGNHLSFMETIISLIVGLVTGGSFFLGKKSSYKVKQMKNIFNISNNSIVALQSDKTNDVLIDSKTTFRIIPKNTGNNKGGGSGGSIHTSSSGTTFRSGGKKF